MSRQPEGDVLDVLAPSTPLMPWWMNKPEMRRWVSSDGQVYLAHLASGREFCVEPSSTFAVYQQLRGDGDEGPEATEDAIAGAGEGAPQAHEDLPSAEDDEDDEDAEDAEEDEDDDLEIVRHLDRQRWRCNDCGAEAENVHFAWSDRRCPQCWSLNVAVLSSHTVPPRPGQFARWGEPAIDWHNAGQQLDEHTWGLAPDDDARMLWQLSSAYRFAEQGHAPLYMLGLLAESLLTIDYGADADRFNLVLNIGNVLDRYFRITGSPWAAKRMLDTFERAAELGADPVPAALARHSFTIGAIYVMDFYEQSEAELHTERPGLRQTSVTYVREAIELAESVRDRDPAGTEIQLGRIRYALADMLRRGRPTETELDEAQQIFADLDPLDDPAISTFVTAARLETQLSRAIPRRQGDAEGAADDDAPSIDLAPWIDAARQMRELIWGDSPLKFEHRWQWALSLGRCLLRLGAGQEARPVLESAVTFARKDTAFDSDPVALTGDAERLFQAFGLLATYYISIGWAFEGLALLETYRGRVLDIAALDDAGRAHRRAEAEEARTNEFFGGMFGAGDSSTLRLTEEKVVEERTGRIFGPFGDDYELPGLSERVDELFEAVDDEPTALLSLTMDTQLRTRGGAWISAVLILPPGAPDPRTRFHTWEVDDDQLAALRSTRHQRPGSFREARLAEVGRASHDALFAPIAAHLEDAQCGRLLVVVPSEWGALPLETAVPPADTQPGAVRRIGLLPSLSFGAGPSRRERRRESERLLIVGYAGPDLPRAEAEAADLLGLFGSSATYVHGADLNKRTIVEHLNSDYDFVHLICHGTYDTAHPLESSLYFDSTVDKDSMRLRARELELFVRMPQQPIVTLSACSTALTAPSRSNTWNGLPGSLLRTGAHAIVASRWPVHDETAARMMAAFYRQLRGSDQSALRCFHLAQDELRAAGSRVEDWATFGYLGRP